MPAKWRYYLSSIPTLLGGLRNWWILAKLGLGLPPGVTIVAVLRDGCRFRVRSFMDLWIIKETCLDRIYNAPEIHIPEKPVIVDIGAGLGDYTVHVARRYPQGRVIAFEPFTESFELLRSNLALNRIQNVAAYPLAVGAKSGPMTLETSTGVAVQHSTASTSAGSGVLAVEGKTLADALALAKIDRCDVLKVDCEGGEYDIFLGADAGTMAKIGQICMEYHDGVTAHCHEDLAAFLGRNGFTVRCESNPVHSNLGLLTAVRSPVRTAA